MVTRLASGKHARPYGMGLNFIKRETKTPFSLFVLLFKSWFTHSDCIPDLFTKKIYGDATNYFNLSGFQPVLIFSFFFRKIIA